MGIKCAKCGKENDTITPFCSSCNAATPAPANTPPAVQKEKAQAAQDSILHNLPPIETQRLILRKISISDADDVFECARDPEVAQYVTWEAHKSIDDTIKYLAAMEENPKNKQLYPWAIVNKADNKVMGGCAFMNWAPEQSRAEIGYMIGKKYWNKGYMTEALREVISFGFNKMGLNRIEALCMLDNAASVKVLEKVGMKFEGVLRQHLFAKGRFYDMKIYSILKSEHSNE